MTDKVTVIQQIQKLDGTTLSMVDVEMPTGSLTIIGAEEGRVRVFFYGYANGNLQDGYLVDDNASARPKHIAGINIVYPENDEWEYIPIEETVSITQAIQVVEFFLDHNSLPPSAKWEKLRRF